MVDTLAFIIHRPSYLVYLQFYIKVVLSLCGFKYVSSVTSKPKDKILFFMDPLGHISVQQSGIIGLCMIKAKLSSSLRRK